MPNLLADPIPQAPEQAIFPEGKPLRGYIGCPLDGVRHNSKEHPGTRKPCVDLFSFFTKSFDDSHRVVSHFERLGYLCWIEANTGTPGGALFIPKLDLSGDYSQTNDLELRELVECLQNAANPGSQHFRRVAKAVLEFEAHATDTADVRHLIRDAALFHIARLNARFAHIDPYSTLRAASGQG